jgi:glycosyltransferase involved in cell wall biosynthesis
MKHQELNIDARMLVSSGIGTYLQNLLKRMRLDALGLHTTIFVKDEAAAIWVHKYQPAATIKFCNEWIYGYKDQLYWWKHLKGGLFWAPHFNIPWHGYEKLIVTIHDCLPLTPFAYPLVRLYGEVMFGRIKKQADAVLTVSEFSKRELVAIAKLTDVPIYVINDGVGPHWFTNQIPPRPYPFKYFVYVGNMKTHKNLVRLLEAYKKVKPTQKLVCVGPFKDLKLRDEKACRILGKMGDRVITTDYVSNRDLRAVVKNADGMLFPSLYEGFGLPPVEAMAAKIPVLVSETSCLPEICGESAFYCDPYSVDDIARGIEGILDLTQEERENRVESGHEYVARYNWDDSAQETMRVFKNVLGGAQ